MAALRFHWLGPPRVERDGSAIRCETRKALALLAYLSLRPVPSMRETLAAFFWPDNDQAHALASLRRALASLNACLGPGHLTANRDTISLCADVDTWVDVTAFRAVAGHSEANWSGLEAAVSLYRGDFLEGLNLPGCLDFDEWQLYLREDLRRELASALERLAQHYGRSTAGTGSDAWERGRGYARRWVALDPLNETAQRALIRLYAEAGQYSAALRQYEECRRLLHDELGQEPEEATAQLCRQIGSMATDGTRRASPAGPANVDRPGRRAPGLSLVKTKLLIPQARRGAVPRPELAARLDTPAPLILISAPAGFGKTTLLAGWSAHTSVPVAWISLDEDDNDAARFLAYLVAAVRGVMAEATAEVEGMLAQLPAAPPSAILAELINGIAARATRLALVLDDYHLITAQAVHDLIEHLLNRMPPALCLILSTRADPPLPIARLRARNQLVELRADDLRFSLAHAAEFLGQSMGLRLAAGDVAVLAERTEGWIAGLQMAALSLQGQPEEQAAQRLRDLAGTQRYILDYLVQEVLDRQPTGIQSFLLQTSVLDRFCGDLCDAALQSRQAGSSQPILEYLHRANLFVVALDDERKWYRYHHLFADLLRARLARLEPGGHAGLHRRASAWFAEQSLAGDAIRHALAVPDFELAAATIEEYAPGAWMRDEMHSLQAWLSALPEPALDRHPRLYLYRALLLQQEYRHAESESVLDHVLPLLEQATRSGRAPGPDPAETLGMWEVLRGACMEGQYQGFEQLESARRHAEHGLQILPARNRLWRCMALILLGAIAGLMGDEPGATRAYNRAEELARNAGYLHMALIARRNLAGTRAMLGRLRAAVQTYREVLEAAAGQAGARLDTAAKVHISLAATLYELNELEDAVQHLVQARDIGARLHSPTLQGYATLHLARIDAARGDSPAALERAAGAEAFFCDNAGSDLRREAVALQARVYLAQGRTAEAASRLESVSPIDAGGGHLEAPLDSVPLTIVRVYVAQGRLQEAGALLAEQHSRAELAGRVGRMVEIRILQALVWQAQGQTDRATEALKQALTMAEPEGFVQVFLDAGKPLHSLLLALPEGDLRTGRVQAGPEAERLRAFVSRLRIAFGLPLAGPQAPDEQPNTRPGRLSPGRPVARQRQRAGSPPTTDEPPLLVEDLTPREFEVLRLLAHGLSNRDIARSLIVAEGTVRAHIASIYRKLDVNSRTQAIARGRALGLV